MNRKAKLEIYGRFRVASHRSWPGERSGRPRLDVLKSECVNVGGVSASLVVTLLSDKANVQRGTAGLVQPLTSRRVGCRTAGDALE